MKILKIVLFALAITVAQNVMADYGDKFEYTEPGSLQTLYYFVTDTPSISMTGAPIPGKCKLISPDEYERWEQAKPEMRFLRPKGAVKYTGQVKIPGQVGATQAGMQGEYTVSEIAANAFVGSEVTSIEVPDSVTTIYPGAFSQCGTLMAVSVSADNPVYSSGEDGVLYDKDGTTLIQLPGGITHYELPAIVDDIDECALFGCENLETITVAEGNEVFEVDNGILYKKNGSGDKVDIIFINGEVKNIVIPEGITEITAEMLSRCVLLETISIPVSVKYIEGDAFFPCVKLKTITVADGNIKYKSTDGALIEKTEYGADLICCPPTKTSFIIPNDVTFLNWSAFYNCSLLTTLNIPASVTGMYGGAFDGCTSLESFTIDPSNTEYSVTDGILFVKETGEMQKVPANKPSFTLNYLPEINPYAFREYQNTLTISLVDTDKPYVETDEYPTLPDNGKTQVNYIRTLEKGKLGTIMLCFIPDNADDFCFYKLSSESNTQVAFERVNKEDLETGIPYLYKNADDDNIVNTMTKSNTDSYPISTYSYWSEMPETEHWLMYGSFTEEKMYGTDYFVLSNNTFRCSNDYVYLAPFHACLIFYGSFDAKEMEIVLDGEPTGIKLADVDRDVVPNSNVQRYNVSGQKVNDNYKGIVITEGKKYLSR